MLAGDVCIFTVFTARELRKVMFLHLSLILFTGGSLSGGSLSRGSLFRVVEVSVQVFSVQGFSVQGSLCLGVSVQGNLCQGDPLPPYCYVWAYGTHPTGMHSCYLICVTVFCVTNHSKTLELSEIFEGEIP